MLGPLDKLFSSTCNKSRAIHIAAVILFWSICHFQRLWDRNAPLYFSIFPFRISSQFYSIFYSFQFQFINQIQALLGFGFSRHWLELLIHIQFRYEKFAIQPHGWIIARKSVISPLYMCSNAIKTHYTESPHFLKNKKFWSVCFWEILLST